MIKSLNTSRYLYILGLVLLFISFWIFGRFTVDDAFISWRYGRNLVDFGIWNYNPSNLDLTQAYTNPLYTFLGILPAILGMDVVLFYKVISLLLLGLSYYYMFKKTGGHSIMSLLFLAMPTTLIHAFGGLETFLFVFLVGALLIELYEVNIKPALLLVILLFYTRPETWLLAGLVPLYFFVNSYSQNSKLRLSFIKGVKVFLILIIPLLLYFTFHYYYFGYFLPNTFYVKNIARFRLYSFILSSIFLLPTLFLLPLKKYTLFFITNILFLAMIYSYSKADLMMDYGSRFDFHIYAPIMLLGIYLLSQLKTGTIIIEFKSALIKRYELKLKNLLLVLVVLLSGLLFIISFKSLGWVATYYPRMLVSHSEVGKLLLKEKKQVQGNLLIPDAGAVPYFSKMDNLDIIGLGSAKIAHNGLSENLLNEYNIGVIALYGSNDTDVSDVLKQHLILDWMKENNFSKIGATCWRPGYYTIYFSKSAFDLSAISKRSEMNNIHNTPFLKNDLLTSPFYYWHE